MYLTVYNKNNNNAYTIRKVLG